jgi:hypothetical protein
MCYTDDQIKEGGLAGRMEGTGEKRNAYRVFFQNLKDKERLRGLFLDWRTVLNLITNK